MNLKENIEDLFASASQNMIHKACELILDGTLGTVLPGVMNTVLAYKQKRAERMYLLFMQELKNRIDELEKNLENISNKSYMEMKEKYFGIISDYVLEEIQEEKIKYLANGFINMSKIKELNENFVLLYYDTLQQLRIIDIAVLKNHERIYSYNQKKRFAM